jgi:predicted alpha/beta-hydrolase family hydrolase
MPEKALESLASAERGQLSALRVPRSRAKHLIVLGHGASTNLRHATMRTNSAALADEGIATFRFNSPLRPTRHGPDERPARAG